MKNTEERDLAVPAGIRPKHAYVLNIAVPTYNRAIRLSRSLDELRKIIERSKQKALISVYVTDNGSTDNTKEILSDQSKKFESCGIRFSFESVKVNKGFDSNIQRCFTRGVGDYCWFVSDDDNLEEDILEKIFGDIAKFDPNLIIYNFDQSPHDKNSPMISETKFLSDSKTNYGFHELITNPKLTALVIKRMDEPLQCDVFNYDLVLSSGFAHTALAMQTGFHFGRVLLSASFCASPDPNHRDHIDFPPYIGNRYNRMTKVLFGRMGKPEWADLHAAPHTDVGVSALEWLIDYYKGRAVVPAELRQELRNGIKDYVAERKFALFLHPKFFRRCIYLAVAWLRYLILEKILHVTIIKERKTNK